MGLKDEINGPSVVPCFPYVFSYLGEKREIHLNIIIEDEVESASKNWLKQTLFPKFIRWAETAKISHEDGSSTTSSLSLVDIVEYNQLYQKLKKKYGPEMLKVFTIIYLITINAMIVKCAFVYNSHKRLYHWYFKRKTVT
jgi:hypothetical protein